MTRMLAIGLIISGVVDIIGFAYFFDQDTIFG